MRRVVVTGLGIIAPTGNSVPVAWKSALDCRSGIGRITRFDASVIGCQIAGEVKGFDPSEFIEAKELRRTTRFIQFAVGAAHEAVRDSGLDTNLDGKPHGATDRFGCSIGVGLGCLQNIETNTIILKEQGYKRVSPFFLPYTIPNLASGIVSREFNLRGPNVCTTTACTSGTHGVGEAFLYIRTGMADVMVCGGAEAAISPLGITSFTSMKALSDRMDEPEKASRPFDRDRDGFVMGEGAGILVVEELEHAKRRGAKIYCEVIGYGMSGDAHHITAPSPGGEGAERCMRMALHSAGITASEVDYINAHGTSTKLNDAYESAAIGRVFGDHAKKVSISSTKGVTGHCLGAAGGIEAVYLAKAILHQVVPPTANYETPDPECPLDYTPNTPKEKPIRIGMSNSFGFGGTNGTIVFKEHR